MYNVIDSKKILIYGDIRARIIMYETESDFMDKKLCCVAKDVNNNEQLLGSLSFSIENNQVMCKDIYVEDVPSIGIKSDYAADTIEALRSYVLHYCNDNNYEFVDTASNKHDIEL